MRFRSGAAAAVVLGTLAASAAAGTGAAAASRATSAHDGARWIASNQTSSGAFYSAAERQDETADDLVALVAGRVGGKTVQKAMAYIAKKGASGASNAAFTGRIIAGIKAAGGDPTDHGNVDFVEILHDHYDPSSGAYDDAQLFDNLLAANGELAANGDLPDEAVDHIVSNECGGGGFGYDNGCPKGADADTTAWAINVLRKAGGASSAVTEARSWLLDQQHVDGGWGFTKDLPTSADSTGLTLSAIAALGENAQAAPWRRTNGADPVKALLKLQNRSGGWGFTSSARPNGLSTRQAVPGMAGLAYPVPHIDPEKEPAPTAEAAAESSSDGGSEQKPKAPGSTSAAGSRDPSGDASSPEPTAEGDDGKTAASPSPTATGGTFAGPIDAPPSDEGGTPAWVWALVFAGVGAGGLGTGAAITQFRRRR